MRKKNIDVFHDSYDEEDGESADLGDVEESWDDDDESEEEE